MRAVRQLLALCTLLHSACAVDPATSGGAAPGGGKADVYGSDDRLERYEIAPQSLHHALATSSGALVDRAKLTARPDGSFDLANVQSLKDHYQLCPDVRFAEQPMLGFCSATLVAPDLVLTAGHCMIRDAEVRADADARCARTTFVLDFAYDAAPMDAFDAVAHIPSTAVRGCARIVAIENPYDATTEAPHDYALVELDRPVTDRAPVAIGGSGPLDVGMGVTAIGHPNGIPQKLSPGSVTTLGDPAEYAAFGFDAEIFSGNSGSGVFDADGALVGITSLSNGGNYTLDPERGCRVPAVCDAHHCWSVPLAYEASAMILRLPAEVRSRLTLPDAP